MSQPLFSVFIPTFNRQDTLPQALQSVLAQNFDDYELLVVDDGSEDQTRALVSAWQERFGGRLRYIWQANQGKHVAYNRAAREAAGELLVLLDSDDTMLPDALRILADSWRAIPAAERDRFAGVEGLCRKSSGELHGTPFPRDGMDSDYLEITRRYGVSGEKRHAIRSDVLRCFPYPVVAGERHVRPSYVWKQIAHHYRFRYINQVLQTVDFRSDGLTRNASRRRLRNPGGLYLYWRDDILHHNCYRNGRQRQYAYAQYVRYALLSGHGPLSQWREVTEKLRWMRAVPKGLSSFVLDRIKRGEGR